MSDSYHGQGLGGSYNWKQFLRRLLWWVEGLLWEGICRGHSSKMIILAIRMPPMASLYMHCLTSYHKDPMHPFKRIWNLLPSGTHLCAFMSDTYISCHEVLSGSWEGRAQSPFMDSLPLPGSSYIAGCPTPSNKHFPDLGKMDRAWHWTHESCHIPLASTYPLAHTQLQDHSWLPMSFDKQGWICEKENGYKGKKTI